MSLSLALWPLAASAVAAGVCLLGALGALALPGKRGVAISTAAARVAGSTGAHLDIAAGRRPSGLDRG